MQPIFLLPFELNCVGERLAQERDACGLSQAALAAAADVSRYTQIKYEKPIGDKDHTFPSLTYINRVHSLGLDMHYVLTGKKGPSHK